MGNFTMVSPRAVRNSELFKLVEKGLVKQGKSVKALLPSGREIFVSMPEAGKLVKSLKNANGHAITSRFDVSKIGTKLASVSQTTSKGIIEQVFCKDGKVGGHIWTHNPWEIAWGYLGNISKPTSASSCIHKHGYKNWESLDVFKSAINYIRGKGSMLDYVEKLTK